MSRIGEAICDGLKLDADENAKGDERQQDGVQSPEDDALGLDGKVGREYQADERRPPDEAHTLETSGVFVHGVHADEHDATDQYGAHSELEP